MVVKSSPLTRYRAKLARMDVRSTQYEDQVKRIKAYERNGSIALGRDR